MPDASCNRKCWLSTVRQTADWIKAVFSEPRVRRSQGQTPSKIVLG